MLQFYASRILKWSDYVFSYGGKITDIISNICDTPIIEIATGIEKSWITSEAKKVGERLNFLFVGRFDRVKGLPELYKAISILKNESTPWHFHFVGPIPEGHQLSSEKCTFHGPVYDIEQMKSHYDGCDVLVNTSISEGMPNVILEAMSRGLAILATDVGATSVLVEHEKNGLLINEPDPNTIVRALNSMIDSVDRINDMKLNSLNKVMSLSWELLAPKLANKIHNCITD